VPGPFFTDLSDHGPLVSFNVHETDPLEPEKSFPNGSGADAELPRELVDLEYETRTVCVVDDKFLDCFENLVA
jgi:hypothetical protein